MPSAKIDLEALNQRLQHVFPMPQILSKIMKTINDPNASAASIEQVFKYEPSFTLKILSLANSAYYGSPGKITNIRTAITLLGFNLIKSIAIHASVNELFHTGAGTSLFSGVDLWKHSVGVAVCAKMIARRCHLGNAEDFFTLGILHDVGLIIEYQFYRNEFIAILKHLQEEQRRLVEVEEEVLGVNHTALTKMLCDKWYMPESMSIGLAYHHHPLEAPEHLQVYATAIYVSNILVHEKQFGFTYPGSEKMDPPVLEVLGMNMVDYSVLLEDFDQEINELSILLD